MQLTLIIYDGLSNIMNKITHHGVVESIDGDEVKVRFLQTSACAACKVAGHCSASDSKEKVVVVKDGKAAHSHELGDQVTVAMSAGNGRLAVVLAFVVPFFILIAVLVLCLWITGDEAMAALVGIASLVPYYVVLHFLEKRISRQFAFVIE